MDLLLPDIYFSSSMHNILFVCSGNLCRSPMALAVLLEHARRRQVDRMFHADSAGLHVRHLANQPADPRAAQVLAARGFGTLSRHRARNLNPQDFHAFDLVLAMDKTNLESLKRKAPPGLSQKVRLLLEFSKTPGPPEIPDPYYGNLAGFERVLELCESGIAGLIDSCLNEWRGA